jgi:NifU-like protein involved in Fe-S cluster formation
MASPIPYPPELMRLARDATRRGAVERGLAVHPSTPLGERQREVRTGLARNPRCGDALSVQLGLAGGVITAARHDGEACALGLAGAAALCEALEGVAVEGAAVVLGGLERAVTLGERPDVPVLAAFVAIHPLPARHRCATLAVEAARLALGDGAPPPAEPTDT